MAARTIGRARSTAAAHCGEGADALTDGTSGGLREERRCYGRRMDKKCRARGNENTDRHCGAPGPGRQPVPCGPHAEQDRGKHQQESDDRRAGLVVGVGDVDAHRGNGQAEGDEGECLHGVRHRGCHVLTLPKPAWKRGGRCLVSRPCDNTLQ